MIAALSNAKEGSVRLCDAVPLPLLPYKKKTQISTRCQYC